MRIPIDEEFKARAIREGLPMFRIQIDWRHVPKELRTLRSHESCGVMTVEAASMLLRTSLMGCEEFAKLVKADGI